MNIPLCDGRECYKREPHQANLRLIDGNKRWRDQCYDGAQSLRHRGVKIRVCGSFGPTRHYEGKGVVLDAI